MNTDALEFSAYQIQQVEHSLKIGDSRTSVTSLSFNFVKRWRPTCESFVQNLSILNGYHTLIAGDFTCIDSNCRSVRRAVRWHGPPDIWRKRGLKGATECKWYNVRCKAGLRIAKLTDPREIVWTWLRSWYQSFDRLPLCLRGVAFFLPHHGVLDDRDGCKGRLKQQDSFAVSWDWPRFS